MTPDELEYWEERAAVFEHEALMPRATAERMADEALIAYRLGKMRERQRNFAEMVAADLASGREQARALVKRLRN